jgi:HEAT repeat protein
MSRASKPRNQTGRPFPEPLLVQVLAAHAAGEDRLADLTRLHRQRPDELEDCLAQMLPRVTGYSRERLSRLAADLQVLARWQEQARAPDPAVRGAALARLADLSWGVADAVLMAALADGEETVRYQACRALLRAGGRRDVEQVFALAIQRPEAIPPALASELARHALVLAQTAIPAALRSRDAREVATTLELIERWAKSLLLPDLPPLLRHPQSEIRARALRVLPYASSMHSCEPDVLGALRDCSADVRAAACFAAARLRLQPALAAIVECLREPDPALARAAAFALAELGRHGVAALEREMRSSWRPETAAAVLETVECIRTERCGYTRL